MQLSHYYVCALTMLIATSISPMKRNSKNTYKGQEEEVSKAEKAAHNKLDQRARKQKNRSNSSDRLNRYGLRDSK